MVANIAMEVVLEIPFLTFNKLKMNFADRKLNWKTYISNETLPKTQQVEIINQKNFMAAALALEKKTFIIYIAYLRSKMSIYLAQEA